MNKLLLIAASSVLMHCAPTSGGKSFPIVFNGKKMAVLEVEDGHYNALIYSGTGRVIYRSGFVGGCQNIPQAGREIIGSRFQYDEKGNFISRWEISPDTSHAVLEIDMPRNRSPRIPYPLFGGNGKQIEATFWRPTPRRIQYIYTRQKLDSVIRFDSLGRLDQITTLKGDVCINFSGFYFAEIADFGVGFSQGGPYLYDTLIHERFARPEGHRTLRLERTRDSVIDIDFYHNGKEKRRFRCGITNDKLCANGLLSEWYESGQPKILQSFQGKRRIHRHFFENGGLMTESVYAGVKLDSVYRMWHENGNLRMRVEYDLGREIKSQEWDESGKEVPPVSE